MKRETSRQVIERTCPILGFKRTEETVFYSDGSVLMFVTYPIMTAEKFLHRQDRKLLEDAK